MSEQRQPCALRVRHRVEPQPAGGDLQRSGRDVGGDDLVEAGSARSRARSAPSPQPRSATRVAPAARKRREHRAAALLGERHRPVGLVVDLGAALAASSNRSGLGVVDLGQPGERRAGQGPLVGEVAAGDQLPLRVVGQPARARSDSLSTSSGLTQ